GNSDLASTAPPSKHPPGDGVVALGIEVPIVRSSGGLTSIHRAGPVEAGPDRWRTSPAHARILCATVLLDEPWRCVKPIWR
ncbi:MAG: hypothetical protein ACOVOI_15210, partial [Hyphomicrobiales bacterium]